MDNTPLSILTVIHLSVCFCRERYAFLHFGVMGAPPVPMQGTIMALYCFGSLERALFFLIIAPPSPRCSL